MEGRIIGITGKYCAGKNLAAAYLEGKGWHCIDVDRTGHRVLELEKDSLAKRFGGHIIAGNGKIDRSLLGGIVFKDRNSLRDLESIVHPRMRTLVQTEAAGMSQNGIDVGINAALLFPMGLHSLCDCVMLVRSPLWVRIARARKRDGLSWRSIFQRFASQRRLFPKKLTKNVDMYNVRNSANRAHFFADIEEFLKLIERQG